MPGKLASGRSHIMKMPKIVLAGLFLFSVGLGALTIAPLEPLPAVVPFPKNNPPTPEKIKLGRQLFFDPRLSVSGTTSCFSCHNIKTNGENGMAYSVKPDGKHTRHTVPTVFNGAFLSTYFWYGTAKSLEEQAEGPLEEMGLGNLENVVKNVAAILGYLPEFQKVFGGENPISLSNITKAVGAFERTLVTPNSPFDRFARGEESAMTLKAKEGLRLFQKIGCVSCHNGPDFAGPKVLPGVGNFRKFPLYGGTDYEKRYDLAEDLGRYNVTAKDEDRNMWRVAPLRNIALTAPYFHNGEVESLGEAVRVMARTQLNLDLDQPSTEKLVAFLKALTGNLPRIKKPGLPQ